MKALFIQVNFITGDRAGGLINHKDPNLRCHPLWQDTDAGSEVRMVMDDNADPYRGIAGVVVLEGEAEIDARVALYEKTHYKIDSEPMMNASIPAKKIKISSIGAEESLHDQTKKLYDLGALGITKVTRSPPKCKDIKG